MREDDLEAEVSLMLADLECLHCGAEWSDDWSAFMCCRCPIDGNRTKPRKQFCSQACVREAFQNEAARFRQRDRS